MDILLTTDKNYIMPTGVLMTSVSLNNPGEAVCYHIIIDETFPEEGRVRLTKAAESLNGSVKFYCLTAEQIAGMPIGKKGMPAHISIAAYYRLFVAEFLPEDLHRVLYLDGDMIVRKSLKELWETDLEGYALGAVLDMDECAHVKSGRLPYPMEKYGYFNSGVLLMNFDYWREHKCTERLLEFVAEHNDVITLHDQDALNCVLYAERKPLPITYNFQPGFIFDVPDMKNYPESLEPEIRKIERDAAIVHYCGWSKPWNFNCMHPQRYVWKRYKGMSQWKDEELQKPGSFKEALAYWIKTNNYWFGERYYDSHHRNIYRRVILKK